jgi:hypothetical protein
METFFVVAQAVSIKLAISTKKVFLKILLNVISAP